MNKVIVTIFAAVGLVTTGAAFEGETYNEHVLPLVEEKKLLLSEFKPPEAFLDTEVSGEVPAAADDGGTGDDDSGMLGDDFGGDGGTGDGDTWN